MVCESCVIVYISPLSLGLNQLLQNTI